MAKQQENRTESSGLTVSRSELAQALGVTPDRVTKYVAEGMPCAIVGGGRGRRTHFDLTLALAWWRDREAGRSDGAREAYYRMATRKLEIEVRTRAGELVSADAIEAQWTALVVATRERVLTLPDLGHQRGMCDACAAIARDLADDVLRDLEQQPRRTVTAEDRDVIRTLAREQYAASIATIHEMARATARRIPAPMRDRLAEAALPHIVDALYDIGPQRYEGDVADEAIQATVQAIVAERGEAPIAAVRASEKARVRAHFRAHGVEVGF